jgi:16S rRNA (adenine1518-N6/adenine1519-N6)-dimethyltransferase
MSTGRVTAKKYLGQHFLKDRGIAARIVESLSAEGCDAVIEVGPGMGVLTQFLTARNFRSFIVVEIDNESVEYLEANVRGIDQIISGDFLGLDLKSFGEHIAVIGNFPYNISSQIFFKILENRNRVTEVTCMVQKEVADRICSAPGSRVYGILSVFLGAWYDINYLFTVGENVFSPPPKVKSAVIRLTRNGRDKLDCDEKLFVSVVRRCFNQRRKMIRNPIKMMISPDAGDMPLLSLRAEQLSVEQFADLTRWVAVNNLEDGESENKDQKE